MSETKHTPMPWRADDQHPFVDIEIVGRPTWACKRFDVEGEWTVAAVDPGAFDDDAEAQANAAFIVKAVNLHDELVSVLRDTLTVARSYYSGTHTEWVERAEAILAKAEAS